MGWDSSYLLHIGMDGPNVNLKFQSALLEDFESCDKSFLDIDTCTLHKVHTSFKKGVSSLPIDIDSFAVNLHGFFKLSSARREDYRNLEALTSVTSQYVLRHSSVRWLTMKYVVVRIIEQWPNLKEYFLKFLPKQKEFKKSVSPTKRYKQIVEILQDDLSLPYLSFVAFLSHQYEYFLLKFQSEEPLIHVLFNGMESLITALMQMFVNNKSLFLIKDGERVFKDVHDLVKLDLGKKDTLKSKRLIDIGTNAKMLLLEIVDEEKENSFRSSCLQCYVQATEYLQQNLPFNNKIIEHAQYFHPEKRNHSMSTSGISNLALKITKVFGKSSQKVFDAGKSPNEIVDLVRSQWKMYQVEEIHPSSYLTSGETEETNKKTQNSYWNYALDYCGLFTEERKFSKFVRADVYWDSIGKITNEEGVLKYPQLFALAKCVLSLSHGNVVPERGFSINKYLLSVHGNSLKEETIVSLRLVKDELCAVGGLKNFKVTRALLKSVKESYSRYQVYLEQEKVKSTQAKRVEAAEKNDEDQEKENLLSKLNQDIQFTKDTIKQLETNIDSANQDISNALKAPTLIKDKILKANTVIDMALERKRKLETTLEELFSRKKKLSKK